MQPGDHTPNYTSLTDVTIDETGADVELRHIWDEPAHRAELQAARGRTTVPVLRISGDGEDRWMPESADIVQFLRELAHR